MPALRFLMLDSNWNLTGQLSAEWGSPLSMGRLSVLSARDCNLGGTLPPSWPTQLPELQVIDLTNNLVMGETQPVPSASQSRAAQASCAAHKQELTSAQKAAGRVRCPVPCESRVMPPHACTHAGTLPDAWSSFNSLTTLSLKNNNLTGTLPNA